jgi:hypothetical protein
MRSERTVSIDSEELVFCAIVFGTPLVVIFLTFGLIFWAVVTFSVSDTVALLLVCAAMLGLPHLLDGPPA